MVTKAQLIKLLEPYDDACVIYVVNSGGLDLREVTTASPLWPGERIYPTRKQKKEGLVATRLVVDGV